MIITWPLVRQDSNNGVNGEEDDNSASVDDPFDNISAGACYLNKDQFILDCGELYAHVPNESGTVKTMKKQVLKLINNSHPPAKILNKLMTCITQ